MPVQVENEHLHHATPLLPSSYTAAPSPILLDTFLLIALRIIFYLLSRRYLLASLNPTLRDISKPEELLPASSATSTNLPSSSSQVHNTQSAPVSDLDDTEDALSPSSSYPPSPASRPAPLSSSSREPFTRRATEDYFLTPPGHSTPPNITATGTPDIELQQLGDRLRDVGQNTGRRIRVLQLSHGRSAVGTKSVKRAARGLNRVARLLFSFCFAESMNLLTLVMFHSLGILHSRSRHVNFSVSLHILLAMILLVVPLVQCLLFTYRSRDSTSTSTAPLRASSLSLPSRLLISLIPFTLYIFLFTRIPPYITALSTPVKATFEPSQIGDEAGTAATLDEAIAQWSASGPEGWEGEGWLASSLGRVVVLGVLVIAGLSGLGAVRTAWGFFEQAAGAGHRQVTDNDLLQAERSLYRVRHDLVGKRDEINRLAVPNDGATTPNGGWIGLVFGSKADQEAASLHAELRGLQQMELQISRSLATMKQRKKHQGFRQTLRGTVYNILGYIFAVYCVARLVMCLTSIFFNPLATSNIPTEDTEIQGHGNTNGDWISFLLALGISHLPQGAVDIDVAVWSRGISLLLTGLLILSSLTMVLRSLGRVLRLTSKTVGAGFLLLTLGQLFATYVISLLVQLRTTLPPAPEIDTDPFSPFYGNATAAAMADYAASLAHSGAGDSLLRSLPDFRVFGRLFDSVFLLSALGTAVYRYVAMKVSGPDDGELYAGLR